MARQPESVLILDSPGGGPFDRETAPALERGVPVDARAVANVLADGHSATVLINAGDWPIGPDLLDRVPHCRCVISYGVGVDWIDLSLASERGVTVVNTPGANAIDVAEHALALILACSKRLLEHDRSVRAGQWRPEPASPLRRLTGRTVGYVAFGNTAQALSPLLGALGVRQCAFDPFADPGRMRELGVEPVTWEELADRSDICSVHLPATPETAGFLDERRIAALRPGAIVVITSRGAVYDSAALARALESGALGAAGLDVFPTEPLGPDDPLTSLPNVVLTPHIAAGTAEADVAAREAVAASLAAVLDGKVPASAVNRPAVK